MTDKTANFCMRNMHGRELWFDFDLVKICLAVVVAFSVSCTLFHEMLLEEGGNAKPDDQAIFDGVWARRAKPLIILHVGPPKTSSTTLQSILSSYRDTLKLDNYLYVGRIYDSAGNYEGFEEEPFFDLTNRACIVQDGLIEVYQTFRSNTTVDWTFHEDTPSCWKDFLVELERIRRLNMNVIISEELLCLQAYNRGEFHYELMKETFRDWDVRVLATYRRYYAWLPSHRDHLDNHRLDKPEYASWNGEELHPIFPQLQESMQDESKLRYPYLDTVVRNYSKYFRVGILNMHDTEKYPTLASQFVCKFLPDAARTCERSLREGRAAASLELNKAKSVFYDMIAMEAFRQGIVSSSVGSRVFVRDQIQHEHEHVRRKSPIHFPLHCPSHRSVRALLDKSLQYERQFFPDFYRRHLGEKTHRKEFWNVVKKMRYCSVDAARTLKEKDWIHFFQRLNERGRRQRPIPRRSWIGS